MTYTQVYFNVNVEHFCDFWLSLSFMQLQLYQLYYVLTLAAYWWGNNVTAIHVVPHTEVCVICSLCAALLLCFYRMKQQIVRKDCVQWVTWCFIPTLSHTVHDDRMNKDNSCKPLPDRIQQRCVEFQISIYWTLQEFHKNKLNQWWSNAKLNRSNRISPCTSPSASLQ